MSSLLSRALGACAVRGRAQDLCPVRSPWLGGSNLKPVRAGVRSEDARTTRHSAPASVPSLISQTGEFALSEETAVLGARIGLESVRCFDPCGQGLSTERRGPGSGRSPP